MNMLAHIRQRLANALAPGPAALPSSLAPVTPVAVGLPNDGLRLRGAGTPIDKPWSDLYQEIEDARQAWRTNPLARRLVGLITSYTVGNGIRLTSDVAGLDKFISDFWQTNNMDLRVDEWSDELSRSGELFPVLFTNPVNGMSSVRVVPACLIERVDYDPDDYELELRYQETVAAGAGNPSDLEAKWWMGKGYFLANAGTDAAPEGLPPIMLHFAVNRPTGALRGESDLAPILPWLRRYSRWLEDRVRLNAAIRAFLWIVKAPGRLRSELEERYRRAPEAGSVIIADESESWQAVTPNLNASDAEKDGRAMRWMVVAGGPGTALLDIGEGEDSNLATGKAMAEQRRRFLRRRQAYLVWMLKDLVLTAWERHLQVTARRAQPVSHAAINAQAPDISPEDNGELSGAARQLITSLAGLQQIVGTGNAFRSMALRLYTKFLGEPLAETEFKKILEEGVAHLRFIEQNRSQNKADGEGESNVRQRQESAGQETAGSRGDAGTQRETAEPFGPLSDFTQRVPALRDAK